MIIIGIDCAVDEKKEGLAKATYSDSKLIIEKVSAGGRELSIVDQIWQWLQEGKEQPALLALDAPLGWPEKMGRELFAHMAGGRLSAEPNDMFSRLTDQKIYQELNKKPLEVGAALIARTAHAALRLLQKLREKTNESIPLVWKPDEVTRLQAIEVYPAATLISFGFSAKDYKKTEGREVRIELLKNLASDIEIKVDQESIVKTDHVLDAVICILAARDFLSGQCIPVPAQEDHRVRKEGWIWVKRKDLK